ncbi:hypothetical protein [Clostridium novyi]|nr:hypothetical protein [Clostridium novyi]
MIKDKRKIIDFSKNEREYVEKNYAWHDNKKIMSYLYENVLEK